jgi:hypothetical protein
VNLLNILINGRQALQQTVIEKNDPLFVEMNQYLNLATRYYEAGKRIKTESPQRNVDYMLSFASASELLGQVLNIFPGNEAALLLEQKIQYETNRDLWQSNASALMNTARRAVSANDLTALRQSDTSAADSAGIDPDKETGLYVKLLVLEEIDPNFPGLKALIYDVEVLLGIIIPETPQAVKNQSLELYRQAQAIWDSARAAGGDASAAASEPALALLARALTIWADNNQASALRIEILTFVPQGPLPALPKDLEYLLSVFDTYFDSSQYNQAKLIIDRAIADYPNFVNDRRVAERKTKVEERL